MSDSSEKAADQNLITRLGSLVRFLAAKLVSPSPNITEPTTRFQARIVTITILILLAMTAMSVMAQSDLSPFTLILLVAGYFISRTRYFTFAAFMVVANISFFVIVAMFDVETYSREVVFMTIAWLTPSLILAGLIFTVRQMLLVALAHLIVPFILPLIAPGLGFREVTVGGGFIMVVSGMVLASMYLRNLLEEEKQKELARLNDELEQRVFERTSQLEAFSYNVSHDLRAPLRAIRGFSEILASDYTSLLDEDGQMYLERIKISSKKMDHLIDDMLMLSRLGRKELVFESINLGGLADTVFKELIGAEERAERFDFTLQECPPIVADRHLVRIMLTNLISNAIKFSRDQQNPAVSFGYHQQVGTAEFYLKDNGIGFDPAHSLKILQPFQRLHTEDEFEGTGVGLAIVNNIIQRHNGQLRIESEPGQGTTVYFSL